MKELVIRSIKCLDISLLGIYFLTLGVAAALIVRRLVDKNATDQQSLSTPQLVGRLMLRTALIMVLTYIIRIVVKKIPFPLNGFHGYNHCRLKEINGGVVMAFAIIALQKEFLDDIKELVDVRLSDW